MESEPEEGGWSKRPQPTDRKPVEPEERASDPGPSEKFKEHKSQSSVSGSTLMSHESEEPPKTIWQRIFYRLRWTVESRFFEIFTIIITLQSMFSDDFRILVFPSILDNVYNVFVFLNILMFIFEIVVASLAKKEYFLSFYFFSDIIATITLVFDFGWLFQAMTGTLNYSASTSHDMWELAKDGKFIRRGTRAGAIIRIIRLLKLLRIIKLYKHINKIMGEIQEWRDNKKNELKRKKEAMLRQHGLKVENSSENSKVGKKLSDLTTRRVIILVLLMLCSVPIFSVQTYKAENTYFEYGPELLWTLRADTNSA